MAGKLTPRSRPNRRADILNKIDEEMIEALPRLQKILMETAIERKDMTTLRFLYEQAVGKAKTKEEEAPDYVFHIHMPNISTVHDLESLDDGIREEPEVPDDAL